MIDEIAFNKALLQIVEKRNILFTMNYNDDGYDDVEEELHDVEDDFNEDYEDFLTEILEKAHAVIKSDADILLPTAYIASFYKEEDEVDEDGAKVYSIPVETGVYTETEDYSSETDTRIVFMPSPARLIYIVNGAMSKELWRLK